MVYVDRCDAGRRLTERLPALSGSGVVVLALPRGGVPVAYPVAATLRVPLDVVVVRKLTVPDQPWLVFGAVGEEGVRVIDEDMVADAVVSEPERLAVTREQGELLRRSAARYRRDHPCRALDGATAVIVDDGLATGASAHAACAVARARGAVRVVFAVPVGAYQPIRALAAVADAIVCLHTPQPFGSIRLWYMDFAEVTDLEVCALLDSAAENQPVPRRSVPSGTGVVGAAGI
ncbi:phosphoribosyltransferase [Nocardia sp. NPDC051052]|uniref:phosphoribosyltransferase n=1 Tax=Nocardia sp. NPDC051052 TaxID=3364322 RepID=UPI00379ABF94